jgi:hypothetical protein
MSKRLNETVQEYRNRRNAVRLTDEGRRIAREQARLWRLNNLDVARKHSRNAYKKNPGARGRLKSTYGITPAEYDDMLNSQKGRCAACGSLPRNGRPLCVDHCHKTGIVRGLLCDHCNIVAGHIEGSRYDLVKAYLSGESL